MRPRLLDEMQQIRDLATVKSSHKIIEGSSRQPGERQELLRLLQVHVRQHNESGDAAIEIKVDPAVAGRERVGGK